MTVAFMLLLGALLVGLAAPRLLEHRLYAGTDPHTALVTWVMLVGSTLLSLTTAAILLLIPDHGPAKQVLTLAHDCWAAVSHGSVPRVDAVAGLLSVVLVAGAVIRCTARAARHVRQRRAVYRKHVDLLRILTGSGVTPGSTLWLDVPDPMAYSVAGRPSLVVASEGLRRQLPGNAVAAVLEHERAHLRGRHHLMITIAEALAVALPWLPLMRRAPDLVRTLVELSADSTAARSHGAGAVCTALLGMSGSAAPAQALGMAPDCVALRLAVLSSRQSEHGRLNRALRSGFAGAIALLVPALTSTALLTLATLALCYTLS